MEVTILSFLSAALYSTVGLAFIVLPRRFFSDSPGEDRASSDHKPCVPQAQRHAGSTLTRDAHSYLWLAGDTP